MVLDLGHHLQRVNLFCLSVLMTLMIISHPCDASCDQEYRVDVGAGQATLHPASIIWKNETEGGTFPQQYLNDLKAVLSFDLDANGMTRLVQDTVRAHIEKLLSHSRDFPINELKNIPLAYLFSCSVKNSTFSIEATSIADGVTKKYSPIPLTGTLSTDRTRLHQLSDFIVHDLFDIQGIATTRILYSKKQKPPTAEIFIMDYDGGRDRQITSLHSLSITPQWIPTDQALSPSGQKPFLFVSYLIGQPKIYISNPTSKKLLRLTKMRGNQLTPAVSPHGNAVSFCSDILGSSDLYITSLDCAVEDIGKPRQVYKTPSCATACPSFSPDGTSLAFVSNKDGSPKIYIVDVPKSGTKLKDMKPVLISKRCKESSAPSWSPDGTKIAYSARTGSGDRQIWIYDLEHDLEQQITSGKGHKENPSWAPNSLHLAYQAVDASSHWQIYLLNLNDRTPRKLSSGSSDHQFPAWEPR